MTILQLSFRIFSNTLWKISSLTILMGLEIVVAAWADSSVSQLNIEGTSVPIHFVDVTEKAGIHFFHADGRSGRHYFVETLGSGVAFFDYDNDGWLDLYFVNGAELPGIKYDPPPTNVLYRNNRDGTFTDVTETAGVGDTGYGVGVCAGDYDNDEYLDLYVTNFGRNVLYRNNGDGTFTDVAQIAGVDDPRWSTGCSFADFDNDGDLDLYVSNYIDYSFETERVCFHRGIRAYCDPGSYTGIANVLYRNNGDGTFTDVTKDAGVANPSGMGLGVVCGDYDNDGDLDIYIANDTTENKLYENNGDGTFTDATMIAGVGYSEDGRAESSMGADFGDYDNDGKLDIVVTNFQGEVYTLYHNDGDGFFSDVSYISKIADKTLLNLGWGTKFFDYDNDGWRDLFFANGHIHDTIEQFDDFGAYEQMNQFFQNDGKGHFIEVSHSVGLPDKAVSHGVSFGDFDNDGDVDIVVSNSHDKPQLLRNDGGNQQNWLIVKLIGTRSNRNAIGARVQVVVGNLTMIDEVRSGSGYVSQNDFRLHFGLGKAKLADRLEIRWPSGVIQRKENISVNQFLELLEPSE